MVPLLPRSAYKVVLRSPVAHLPPHTQLKCSILCMHFRPKLLIKIQKIDFSSLYS